MFEAERIIGSNSKRAAGSTATVLIVEDETELADTLARVLQVSGFECVVAHDGPSAYCLFDFKQPAVVLSEINLPIGDGFEITRHVWLKSPATPVILMTAYHTGNTSQEASRAGAAQYLRKPFPNSELISTIKLLLRNDRGGNSDSA